MTTRKGTSAGKRKSTGEKLALKRETIKDLNTKTKAKDVKGGGLPPTNCGRRSIG